MYISIVHRLMAGVPVDVKWTYSIAHGQMMYIYCIWLILYIILSIINFCLVSPINVPIGQFYYFQFLYSFSPRNIEPVTFRLKCKGCTDWWAIQLILLYWQNSITMKFLVPFISILNLFFPGIRERELYWRKNFKWNINTLEWNWKRLSL